MTASTTDLDAEDAPDRLATARVVAAVLLGAAYLTALAVSLWRPPLLFLRTDHLGLLSLLAPIGVIGVCAWLFARARTDGDAAAAVGALAVGGAAFVGWLPVPLGLGGSSATLSGLAGVSCLGCAALGAWALRTPWHALLRPPRPVVPALIAAAVTALLLSPALQIVEVKLLGVASEGLGGLSDPAVPSIRDCVRGDVVRQDLTGGTWLGRAVALSLLFPGLEVLLHGVARRAFARTPPVRLLVATALAGALMTPTASPSTALYGGLLVTGVLTRRTESVVTGIVFWHALALAPLFWRALVR